VARLIAHRASREQIACSVETGAYCQARKRLLEKFFSALSCLVGRALDSKVDPKWLWKVRQVFMFYGTTVSMPDTPENQQAYPQVYNQKPGAGFPIARVGAIISLSCGAILNLGDCRYAGKGQGEVSLFHRLWNVLCPGDVPLADRLMSNWTNILLLKEHGIGFVGRLNKALRKVDFRCGKRLAIKTTLPAGSSQRPFVRWTGRTTNRYLDPSRFGKRGFESHNLEFGPRRLWW